MILSKENKAYTASANLITLKFPIFIKKLRRIFIRINELFTIRTAFKYILICLICFSCKKENAVDCFKSNGDETSQIRYPGGFKSIEVYDKFDVTIVQGPDYKVEITCGEHIIRNISSKVKDSVLKIENNNKCNFVRGYKRKIKITVTLPYLVQVSNYGVGPITLSQNFKQDQVLIRAENSGDTYINGTYDEVRTSSHGNGDMYLKGFSKRLMIYTYGTNYTWAEDFHVSDYIFIATKSMGDTYFDLDGLNTLEYIIYDQGNIYYKGKAHTIRDLSETEAKGKAIQQD